MKVCILNEEELSVIIDKAVSAGVARALAQKQPEKLYGRKEVADMLHISLASVHNYIKDGRLIPIKKAGHTLFTEANILNLMTP